MSVEQNKATIRRVIDEIMKGNVGVVEEAFSPNFAYHSHTHSDRPLRGLQGARTMTTGSEPSESEVTIEDIFLAASLGSPVCTDVMEVCITRLHTLPSDT